MSKFTLPAPGRSESLLIEGPGGVIEALLAAPAELRAPAAAALVCHPHPLMGGAMSNKVAYTLASAALKAGAYALRFNFRGVGKSAGVHDQGRGETEDVIFLADWLRAQVPDATLILAGFSFGAFVSLQASVRVQPAVQISIAPPFGKYFGNAPLPQRPPCPWLVVHGLDDEVVAYEETAAILKNYTPAPELSTLDGVGHFFNGRLTDLQSLVTPFILKSLP